MSILFPLLNNGLTIFFPRDWAGILVSGAGCLIAAGSWWGLLRHWRTYNRPLAGRLIVLLVALALAVPATSLLLGYRLPAKGALPLQDMPLEPEGPVLMVLAALPWVLAAGLLGPLPASGLAFLSGLILSLWDTHSIFTPFELAILALLFSAAVNQRYRTRLYAWLRNPVVAALLVAALYPLIFLIGSTLGASGVLANRLDYTFTRIGVSSLAFAVEVLVAGLAAAGVRQIYPQAWGGRGALQPSPAERSLQARLFFGMAPVAFLLLLGLVVGDWWVAEKAARGLLEQRMSEAAQMAARSIPFFIETGESLATRLAQDPRLYQSSPDEVENLLAEGSDNVAFFHELVLYDENHNPIAGIPKDEYKTTLDPQGEEGGVSLAFDGLPIQTYSTPPDAEKAAAQVSFIAAVFDGEGAVRRVLVGRADLISNPFSRPVLASLESIQEVEGVGILVDESGKVLYHPNPDLVMTDYPGSLSTQAGFLDETAADGTRQLVYRAPAEGRPWMVVLAVPARHVQQIALSIASPLLGMIAALALFAVFLLRVSLRTITSSLENLAVGAGNIAQGQLDHPLPAMGEDEAGRLGRAFEQMRLSLKARLDELNRLLMVSKGVASSLDVGEAVKPVLEAALVSGASSARVVLDPAALPDLEGTPQTPPSFYQGSAGERFAYLDEQILALNRQQDKVLLTNLTRPRLLKITPGYPRPSALMAVALRHENQYYGTLWVAYDQAHTFSDEETRFLVTLAGQAALAAANTRHYMNAEIGRQRLAAILASTPDPVLVTDQQNRLLLANPAAWQVLSLGIETDEGKPVESVINQKELLALLRSADEDARSTEVRLPDKRVYFATATSVLADGQRVGRVCVMRDVTSFKELDELKSEFVSTVSHDLRSPLTLMRGYATMLEMVGELNEQQLAYVRKIVGGVESMSRLVSNLLDLGRIEAGIGLQLEMVPVRDVVERVTGALQLQATQKKIQLSVEIPEQTIPLLEADPALLQQALQNLVENAIKYTESGGKVRVGVSSKQERLAFEVSDTGIGIAPVDQPRLFEKFFRAAQPVGKTERGTGLGLAIVKSIAERHGGQVWVESQLGKGSTFFLVLPVRQTRPAMAASR
jgi:PAS domain S-box-containing protein